MSSPLAVLKKKRTCLDVHRQSQSVPFRRNLLKEVTDELEASGPRPPLVPHTSDVSTSASQVSRQEGAPPSNTELLSAMMKRVTLLETTVRSQTKEIKLKDKKILALERKGQCESESTADQSDRSSLEKRCEHLQKQVSEMESFLKDYGLIWVGGIGGPDPGGASTPSFGVNFDLVLQRIRELNVIAGEGESVVRSTASGAQLATKESVRLSLYRDGIVLFDGPFRSYREHGAQQFIQDLMDGYFPSELQSRFPDGIPFEVCDRRNEEFISRLTFAGKKVRVDQFLNRLPKVVIKNGHVIDIRNSLRDTLQGSSKPQTGLSVVVDTPALHTDEERVHAASPDVLTLKIKSEDGNRVFILKMCFSETIGHLRRYLDAHRGSGRSGYDIISARPRCCYSDDSQRIGCCGFASKTTLLLQKRKHGALLKISNTCKNFQM